MFNRYRINYWLGDIWSLGNTLDTRGRKAVLLFFNLGESQWEQISGGKASGLKITWLLLSTFFFVKSWMSCYKSVHTSSILRCGQIWLGESFVTHKIRPALVPVPPVATKACCRSCITNSTQTPKIVMWNQYPSHPYIWQLMHVAFMVNWKESERMVTSGCPFHSESTATSLQPTNLLLAHSSDLKQIMLLACFCETQIYTYISL